MALRTADGRADYYAANVKQDELDHALFAGPWVSARTRAELHGDFIGSHEI